MIAPIALFAAAALISVVWLGVFASLLSDSPGWSGLASLPAGDLVTVLAAGAAPVVGVFLLVVGVLFVLTQRRNERTLRLAGSQTRRNAEEVESLVRAVIVTQEQLRRQSFLDGVDLAIKDLTSHLGQFMERLRVVEAEEAETLWALTAAGDVWAMPNTLLVRARGAGDRFADMVAERMLADGFAAAALQRFLRRHGQLLERAREDEETRLLREMLEDGPMDQVAVLLAKADARMRDMLGEGGGSHAPQAYRSASPPPPLPDDDIPDVDDEGFVDDEAFVDDAYLEELSEPEDDPEARPFPEDALEGDALEGGPEERRQEGPEEERDEDDLLGDEEESDLDVDFPPGMPLPEGAYDDFGDDEGGDRDQLAVLEEIDHAAAPPQPSIRRGGPHIPAGGGPQADEPTTSPQQAARRIPYPPMKRDEVESIQERVARSLSRSVLSGEAVDRSTSSVAQRFADRLEGRDTSEEDEDPANQYDMFHEDAEQGSKDERGGPHRAPDA